MTVDFDPGKIQYHIKTGEIGYNNKPLKDNTLEIIGAVVRAFMESERRGGAKMLFSSEEADKLLQEWKKNDS